MSYCSVPVSLYTSWRRSSTSALSSWNYGRTSSANAKRHSIEADRRLDVGSANGYLQETQPAPVSRLSPSWGSPPARWCRSGHEEPTTMPFTGGDGLDKAEAVAEPEGFAATFVFLYRQIHDQLRDEVPVSANGRSAGCPDRIPALSPLSSSTSSVPRLRSCRAFEAFRAIATVPQSFSACGGPRGTLEPDPRYGSAS